MSKVLSGIEELTGSVSSGRDVLELFLEKHVDLIEKIGMVDDAEEHIQECLEELVEEGFGVYSVDGNDDAFPALSEDSKAEIIVSSGLMRRKNEGREVKGASHVVLSVEGHVFVISQEEPETSSVIRAAA